MGSNYKAEIILLKELSNYITTKCIRYTSVILSPANDILKEDINMVKYEVNQRTPGSQHQIYMKYISMLSARVWYL